ncbi:hypothetical protein DYB32_003071 [Aphanomyces invadans]|uniref:Uncharacterized protein n=1 Tax=Aphanomyces invadans TaxID=157072 RepID=A0A418B202_9STRA|nr:hypothetical protein DYB32_003071 [Aphanomyces invadans]
MCSRHNYMYKEDAVVEPTMGVSNLPSSDESDTTDDLVTLLKEISILHIDNVMVDAPCDATNMTMEFSREDCDWLACMMSSMAYEQLLAVSQ